ncbi:anthrax toxin receptor-like [Phodopus roborovskii]|uniref:anthrax toxin receptor-like n=1 Tax=Phodopus roborovskii TaxID=109678 RepID=UPI0021E4A292|nr:anthrax toxin receptor-like [Phodopus roborovskii]
MSTQIPDPYQVNVNARGFKNTNDLSQVISGFTFSDSRVVDESPTDITDTTINCPGTKIQHTGEETGQLLAPPISFKKTDGH